MPADGELTAARVAEALRRVLAPRIGVRDPPDLPAARLPDLPVRRKAYFCSGCPHNRSTVVPEGSLAEGGIGCHGLVAMMNRPASTVMGLTQMGGEGAQWIGQAFAHDGGHLFQNVGDGTFFHSGQLGVQACVAAGVNITFKLLYNSAVAMTGGQDAVGSLAVPEITRKLEAEGVRRTIVCTDEPDRYKGSRGGLAANAEVWSRTRLDEAQRVLRDTPGVTVLVYDQRCAADLRRLRRRGQLPPRPLRVVVNEDVCEGCGDCGRKKQLPFGASRRHSVRAQGPDRPDVLQHRLHVPRGRLPVVRHRRGRPAMAAGGRGRDARRSRDRRSAESHARRRRPTSSSSGSAAPASSPSTRCSPRRRSSTGWTSARSTRRGCRRRLARSSRTCVSQPREIEPTNRVGVGQADCYLALDVLTGSESRNLVHAHPGRTAAFVSTSVVPTGAMVERSAAVEFPPLEALLGRIRSASRRLCELDTIAAANALFGHTTPSHFLLVGAAFQSGALPISAAAIERALELNGVGVAANIAAFRWGRVAIADPAAFAAAAATAVTAPRPLHPLPGSPLAGPTRDATAIRAQHLVDYGGERLARSYLEAVEGAWQAERRTTDATDFSHAVAVGLHRALAYKDEYEVARLVTTPAAAESILAQVPDARRIRVHLHPPLLRALGLRSKLALGPSWTPVLRLLARARFLRGTAVDPFRHTRIRRAERALARDYRMLVSELSSTLDREGYEHAVAVATAIELVRGYEELKLESLERYRERLVELGACVEPAAEAA